MKLLNSFIVAACLSIIFCEMFNGVAFALEPYEASVNVNWQNPPYYQDSNATVIVYFHNNSTEQVTIWYLGFHFDWLASDSPIGFDISDNPVNVTSYGSYTFNPMTIHIPANVTVGSHSYFIDIDGTEGPYYDAYVWYSPTLTLQIQAPTSSPTATPTVAPTPTSVPTENPTSPTPTLSSEPTTIPPMIIPPEVFYVIVVIGIVAIAAIALTVRRKQKK